MRLAWMLTLSGFALAALAAEPRVEVDPNTKIEGGADVKGSGTGAGATTMPDKESENSAARPDKRKPDEDKPISARKPQEREPEETTIPDTEQRRKARPVP